MPATSSSLPRAALPAVPRTVAREERPGARRRILIVCPEAPAPPTWGFALRVYHLARELSRRHDVSLLTYDLGDRSRDWRHLGHLFTVHRVPAANGGKRWRQVRSLGSRTSFHLGRLRSAAMQQALDEMTARERFDVIQVESSQMFGFDFPSDPALVLDEHNIEYALLQRIAALERSLPRRIYHSLEQRKVEREETAAWRRVDGCVVTSAEDQQTVHDLIPTARTRIVANGVALEHFAPVHSRVDSGSAVFVGSINYRPNTDAVLYFAEHILPLVRRARNDATLTVVGQGAPESVRRLHTSAVHIAGAVPDVRPFLAGAGVVVVPLRMGGGTRLKVLEALAMGKAVVTTSLGCEGIDVEDGRHLLVADDPEAFAESVLAVMADEKLRARLGIAGRQLVETRYGWHAVCAELESFHEDLIELRRGATQ